MNLLGDNPKFFFIDVATHQVLNGNDHEMKLVRYGLGLGLFDKLGKLDKQIGLQINVSHLNLLIKGLAQLLPATIE